MSAELRLAQLNLELPPVPQPIGRYVPFRIGGNTLFLSGVGPRRADGTVITGQIGEDLTLEQGYEAARICGLNLLANIRGAVGSLDRVDTILKVVGMIHSAPGFVRQAEVLDGCTDLFFDVFGENGVPARSAPGMGPLPRNVAVICDATVLLRA